MEKHRARLYSEEPMAAGLKQREQGYLALPLSPP